MNDDDAWTEVLLVAHEVFLPQIGRHRLTQCFGERQSTVESKSKDNTNLASYCKGTIQV